ncbi:MAG: hypothetical protein AB7N76_12620 [Planctomycetota bacterium]
MSDEEVRELERRFRASGSVEDEAALWQARLRLGQVEPRGRFLVRLRLFSTEEGGRRGLVYSVYRPNWDIGNKNEGRPTINGAEVFLVADEPLAPGQVGLAWLRPLVPDLWSHVQVGQEIALHEGKPVLGTATVLVVLPAAEAEPNARGR